ncbi:DUF4298 domain-containing protein [Campylobacter ureolyticus]|uniref:DUF4298 domain-containing protein n=1 Tax=Campylobacter ureolyticus TaxID=827 RepID=UPI0022B40E20|nr:DUF4298 domain-containing protein [Campylobacter ureolyticus]MCZ6105537.1 DUF4298 domain-containing protein [Campylobacter ureolyticus]MCZ6111818.1 DUF4298 domain-containing protein [Campylobacter ureolyticus]MDK8323889.1 DUF4298 domain-containing protein [Campylobacter ureolyticus]
MKNLNEEKFAHITVFEKNLEFQIDTLDRLNKILKTLKKSLKEYQKLMDYYYGKQRNDDLEADRKGEIPTDLKRAVLSEDEIYNMMIDYRESAIEMIEIATKMLRA